MKMYCCARGTFHCQYANEVKFDKLKTKYSIDEDIVVHYIIRDRVSEVLSVFFLRAAN